VAFGCTSGPTAPSGASAACDPLSTSANAVLPIFGRPFEGAFPIGSFFDHQKPIDGDANGYVLPLCGARDTKQVDGHPGYDWRMPEGTPLFAVADAVVLTAGLEAPHFCPQLNRTVEALLVQLVHTAPTGESYVSVYGHAKTAVLNSLTSASGQRTYDHAIREFVAWYCSEPRLAFNRTVVLRYRIRLEQRGYAPATINLRLAAVRRVAYEASDAGLLSLELAAGIRRMKGVRRIGVRLGNWLTPEQGRRLLDRATAPSDGT